MTLKDYIFQLKDRLMLPHGTYASGKISDDDDDFDTNEMLKNDIHQALRKVCGDAKLFIREYPLALVANQYEYGYPTNCLKIQKITHTYNNTITPLIFQEHSQFVAGFDPTTETGVQPVYWTSLMQKPEVHRFWQSNDDDYATTSLVTTGDSTYLYDQYANFGVLESGEYAEPDDYIWNDTDDSYAQIDYFEMNSSVVTGTASGGSTTTLTTADSLTNAKVDHLIWDTTANIWGFITAINTTTGAITVNEWNAQGSETTPSAGDSFKIGIANEIYFKALHAFTTRGVQGGSDNTFATGDTYRLQDKWYTTPSLLIKPVPTSDDTTGDESITIYYSAEPQQMIDDDDPCVLDDQWSSYIIDYAFYLAMKRKPDRLGEAESLEMMYKDKISEMKSEQATQEFGEADNLFSHINPVTTVPTVRTRYTKTT